MNPIFLMASTSPLLDTGMCPICYDAMRLLLNGMLVFLIGGCFGGEVIRGVARFCRTSHANLARRRAALPGVKLALRPCTWPPPQVLACCSVLPPAPVPFRR